MFRSGAAGAGFVEAAAFEERNDGQHLRAGTEFENRKQIRQVVAQHVACYGNTIESLAYKLERRANGFNGGQDPNVETGCVMVFQVDPGLRDQIRIVRAILIQPEDGRSARGSRATDGQL